jgi:hypothetical protein
MARFDGPRKFGLVCCFCREAKALQAIEVQARPLDTCDCK